jgi:peptidoglycan-associated lipoprotein
VTTVEEDLDDLNSEVRSLAEEFDVTIQRLDNTLRFNMPVFFTFDSHELRPQDLPVLDRFSRVVRDYYPDVKITVEGFTDPAGEASYNLELGRRRADAVRSYLVSQAAVDQARIRAVSYGEDVSRLLEADAQGPGDRGQANRRVVLVIDHAQGSE